MNEEELTKNFARVLRAMYSPEVLKIKMVQYLSTNTRSMMNSLPTINGKAVMVLVRLFSYFLFKADPETRKMFFQVLGSMASHGFRHLDESFFHLLAYKHLRTHYYRIAEIIESKA